MTIEQRVTKLEKQNRWMKRAGGSTGSSGSAVLPPVHPALEES